jgi:hypothetical protein
VKTLLTSLQDKRRMQSKGLRRVRICLEIEWGKKKSVPDDWVNDHLKSWADDDRRHEAELRQAEFVSAGSLALFKLISEQLEADITKFHNAGGDRRLKSQFIPSNGHWVTRREYPMVELKVKAENGYITYSLQRQFDHASKLEETKGAFLITSDLQGRLQVRKNGEPFKNHSELSQLLLLPVFEYIRQNR